MKLRKVAAVPVLFLLCCGTVGCVEICENYPSPDPCRPGGVWDPILNSCSGTSGSPCYQCFSGSQCETREDYETCQLSATFGNPIYLSEYWLNPNRRDPCTSILGHYRPGYQFGSSSSSFQSQFEALKRQSNVSSKAILQPLTTAIQTLHTTVGNAVTEGYQILTGFGGTMVISTAVAALTRKLLAECSESCPDHIDVFAQRPYYEGYTLIVEQVPHAQWNLDADPNSPWTIEILTYPNNPSGEKRPALVQDRKRIIMDMVYYWPMYTDIDAAVDADVMIFSSSKHDGLAGTRFGWALVKDSDLASLMRRITAGLALSFSIDVELRVLTSLQAIIGEGVTSKRMFPFHQFGRDVIYTRFSQLQSALQGCSEDITFLNDVIKSPGAYAWIYCKGDVVCTDYFAKVNLIGSSGVGYGATNQYLRLSMLLPEVEFDTLILKAKQLCTP